MVVGIDASRANKPIRTGTEWYSFHLIQELKTIIPSDVQVRLYTRESLRADFGSFPSNWDIRILHWPPRYLWTLLRLSWEMITRPPDVLFVPAHGIPIVLPRATVTTIHDIGFDRFPELYKRRQVFYHRFSVRRSLLRCTRIITISDFTKYELQERYRFLHPPIDVIPLAHDARQFYFPIEPEAITRVREHYALSHPYFLFIGRLEYKKNVQRMIESLARFHHINSAVDLVLVGPWGYGRETFLASIHQQSLDQSVRCLAWVPEADVAPLMAGAVALLFPTLYEGFGLPILEAMAVGTPVITSDRGANKEVAGDAAELVDPEQVESIAAAMLAMMSHPERAAQWRERGLRRAAQFSWQRAARETWHSLQVASGHL